MTLWQVVGFGFAAGVAFSLGQALVGLVFALLARAKPQPPPTAQPETPKPQTSEPLRFYNG